MTKILQCSALALSLSPLAAMLTSSCDISCEGGSWEKTSDENCEVTGTATLAWPQRFGLPTTLTVTDAGACVYSGCTPHVDLATSCSGDAYGFKLYIETLHTDGVQTYAMPTEPFGSIVVEAALVSQNNPYMWLRVVSGTITVDRSLARKELHVAFDLELVMPSTDERFLVTGGTAYADKCSPANQRMVCVGGD
jgi:hypothetical protein